jgi:transposase
VRARSRRDLGQGLQESSEFVEKLICHTILFAVTIPCCANQRCRRYFEDDGRSATDRVVVLLFYSPTGRPSVDREVLLRLLLVGYLYGITSERRSLEEVRMHLASRWFSHLGFEQEIPDHSTFSKNRHGRFRQSAVFQSIFEEIVHRCLEAGLVEGRNLAVDGTLVEANASNQSRVPRERLAEMAQVSRTVQEYLTELEQQNPVANQDTRGIAQEKVSTTDPDAAWAIKGLPARLGYFDNYLVDTASRVILAVEATPARFRQESLAARRIPLRYRGLERKGQGYIYYSTEAQCQACPQKRLCTPAPVRKLYVHWQEPARQAVRAFAGTPEYERSRRARYKVEALFAELKQQIRLRKVRLRRLWNVAEQFHLAATAQNLKRLVPHLARKQSAVLPIAGT